MSILRALEIYYDRMAARGEAEAPGFSREKIGFCLSLSPMGDLVEVIDLRDHSGRNPQPRSMDVPAAVKRGSNILPNCFWDKTAYVLGRTAGHGRRTAEEHVAFKALHRNLLADADDAGLVALARFLERWRPVELDGLPRLDLLDANVVFSLTNEHG